MSEETSRGVTFDILLAIYPFESKTYLYVYCCCCYHMFEIRINVTSVKGNNMQLAENKLFFVVCKIFF